MKRLFCIRTGLLLVILIFAVLGGNFLYTGAESAAPLNISTAALPLNEDTVLVQAFSPQYTHVTALALAFRSYEGTTNMSGDCTVTLSDAATDTVIYTDTFSLEGVPNNWYIDFPVNCRLNTNNSYNITVSAANCPDGKYPCLCLTTQSTQIPEITSQVLSTAGGDSLYTGEPMALRLTYNVPVPARVGIFIALLIGILLGAGISVLSSRGEQKRDITLGKLLAIQIRGVKLIHILFFLAVTISALIIRIAFFSVKSNDYYIAYEVWINEIRSNGGLSSLGKDIGDNPPLYMTLVTLVSYLPFDPVVIVKLPSCLFDFVLAFAGIRLAKQLGITHIGKKLTLYAVILLNPLTLLNSSAWGQCDSIYSTFILLTLCAMCASRLWNPQSPMESSAQDPAKKAYGFWRSGDGICLLFSIALSFKLQAVFFLPVICLMWIVQKRTVLKPVQLLWVPIVYTASCIPMYLAGRSLKVMFKVYLGQANRNYGSLTLNYPNLYNLIGTWSEALYDSYYIYGMLLVLLLLITLFYQLYCRKVKLSGITLCKVTALSILVICFCLPLIHERYAYVAEILLLIIMIRQTKYIKIALITMLCTLFTYCTYLMQLERSFSVLPDWALALIRLCIIYYLTKDIFCPKSKEIQTGQ